VSLRERNEYAKGVLDDGVKCRGKGKKAWRRRDATPRALEKVGEEKRKRRRAKASLNKIELSLSEKVSCRPVTQAEDNSSRMTHRLNKPQIWALCFGLSLKAKTRLRSWQSA
jgi:hypothetical protein